MTRLKVLNCDGCGVCCMHMSSPPYDEEEIDLLRQNLPTVYADYQAAMASREVQLRSVGTNEIPCGFFDMVTRKCRHHEHKPDVCVRFDVGQTACLEMRHKIGLSEPADVPRMCPRCCGLPIEKGLAIAGELCQGCRFEDQFFAATPKMRVADLMEGPSE